MVGSRVDTTITAIPGPATGSREDLIWVDTQPDAGTWIMRVITEGEAASRFGLEIGRINVPANATLASQMDIRPIGARLERRLMLQNVFSQLGQNRNEQLWGDAWVNTFAVGHVLLEPGQWYKARFTANSPLAVTGTLNGRIGIGMRTEGQPANASELGRANAIAYRQLLATRRPPRLSGYFGTRRPHPRLARCSTGVSGPRGPAHSKSSRSATSGRGYSSPSRTLDHEHALGFAALGTDRAVFRP